MLVRDLKKGILIRPIEGPFYLYQDTWVSMPGNKKIVLYDIATTYSWTALRHSTETVRQASYGVFVGKTRDPVKIVGSYTSYNLLIDGKLYKISGREFKNLECISNIGEDSYEKDNYKNCDP